MPPEPTTTRADSAARVIAEMRAAGLEGGIAHDEIAGSPRTGGGVARGLPEAEAWPGISRRMAAEEDGVGAVAAAGGVARWAGSSIQILF